VNNSSQPGVLRVSVGVHCHQGYVRAENQDRISRFLTPLGDFFVVADGLGGHSGGAEAARLAIEAYARHLGPVPADAEPVEALREVTGIVNAEIYSAGRAGDARFQGMGSTVVFVLLRGAQAIIGHVGDSRAYHVHGGRLSRITRDHSAVQALLDSGAINESQAREHPDANVLTRSLGHRADVEVDFDLLSLEPGDALLLCSDGLWGYVPEAEIAAAAGSETLTAQGVANALLDLALAAGGQDNVSIEYLRFSEEAPVPPPGKVRRGRRVGYSAAVLAALVFVGLGMLYTRRAMEPGNAAGAVSEARQPSAQDAGAVPASGPAQREPGAAQSGVAIGVLAPRSWQANPGSAPSWVAALEKADGVRSVEYISDPNGKCAAQATNDTQIFYRDDLEATASVVHFIVGAPLEKMTDKVRAACGPYAIAVLPKRAELP
jgi:serine/threonine protein phosphatase PrpC